MPIKSYLAYPARGRTEQAAEALLALPGCFVLPAENKDLLILVTDTATEADETVLEAQLAGLDSLQGLALVSAADPDLVQIQPSPSEVYA